MESTDKPALISWKQLSPIFADVVLSPWNLLIGGLLIRYMSAANALISIGLGYGVLAIVFVLYGGLGFTKRMQSAGILQEVFPGRFSTLFIPLLLALGQLGWAAINISLGGTSLAALGHVSAIFGMVAYALIIAIMAGMQLYRLAIVKLLIIISAIGLVVYIGALKLAHSPIAGFWAYQPHTQKSIFWGCSIVVASLISFGTVSPDFFQSVRHKTDIARSTLLGIVLPGAFMCAMGCLFFYNASNKLNLVALISGLSFAALPHIFNSVTNTDGSMALYTPALKFQFLFRFPFMAGVVLGAVVSVGLAIAGITTYLEVWLKVLSLISPIFIGVAFAAVLFSHALPHIQVGKMARVAYGITAAICIGITLAAVPVMVGLVLPLIIYSLYLQYRFIHA